MTMRLTQDQKDARKEFRKFYSATTMEVLNRIAKGEDTVTVAAKVGVSPASVRTTKGNLTRGVYSPFCTVTPYGEVISVL